MKVDNTQRSLLFEWLREMSWKGIWLCCLTSHFIMALLNTPPGKQQSWQRARIKSGTTNIRQGPSGPFDKYSGSIFFSNNSTWFSNISRWFSNISWRFSHTLLWSGFKDSNQPLNSHVPILLSLVTSQNSIFQGNSKLII